MQALTTHVIARGLADESSGVREHAVRLAEPRLDKSPELLDKVLALAGGLKTTAKPHQAVILRNAKDSSKRQEVAVDLSKVLGRKEEDARLLPGDILFVPDSTGKRALRRVGEMAIGLTSGLAIVRASR